MLKKSVSLCLLQWREQDVHSTARPHPRLVANRVHAHIIHRPDVPHGHLLARAAGHSGRALGHVLMEGHGAGKVLSAQPVMFRMHAQPIVSGAMVIDTLRIARP